MKDNRKYDIIIWGASGFTGRLVAEYIYHNYTKDGHQLKWAMAGRNQQKLEAVRDEIGVAGIDILTADSHDRGSLDVLTQQTKVICTTVGPYALYGSELVASCVENGTDYCDLTGEVQWIRKMIDEHHEAAIKNKVKIVHCCGFDSIPSEYGVYYLQQQAKATTGEYCDHVKFRVKAFKGGLSGGTYASLSNVMAEAEKDKSIYKTLFDPYGLNPNDMRYGKDRPDLKSVVIDEDLGQWITPFVMAAINTKVVRRSHALSGFQYGEDFKYDEAVISGSGLKGRFKGIAAALPLGLMMSAKPGSILKKLIDRSQPKPGEGPNKEQRESGFYNIKLIGKFKDGSKIEGKVTGDRDPGYGSTSKMLGEAAICLAVDREDIPDSCGVITPTIAMGDALLNRLRDRAGLTFSTK